LRKLFLCTIQECYTNSALGIETEAVLVDPVVLDGRFEYDTRPPIAKEENESPAKKMRGFFRFRK
jgi:hypothetical protein